MKINLRSILLAVATVLFTTIVCKAADYEEVGYEDLVRQISAKKRALQTPREAQPFDSVMLHPGFGYVNSFSEMVVGGRNVQRYQNGLEISLGVDLFSANWYSETSFRNFGVTNYGSEEITSKELNLKIGYKDRLEKAIQWRAAVGLANRYLKITDSEHNVGADDTTPMFAGSAGLSADASPFVSFGIDLSAKSSLINRTADKSAYDISFNIRATL